MSFLLVSVPCDFLEQIRLANPWVAHHIAKNGEENHTHSISTIPEKCESSDSKYTYIEGAGDDEVLDFIFIW
jgi:hypothetical protein